MNGVHDLGGMHGFGPVEREENEPVFHADWERRVYAINRAIRVRDIVNIDESRHGIERMGAAYYLESSYYEHWLDSVERLLLEKGIISREELAAKRALVAANPDAPTPRRADPALIELMLKAIREPLRIDYEPPAGQALRFAVGDRVVTRNFHPTGHTRLPRYARGKRGTVQAYRGIHTFPDAHAHGQGEQPQPLYSVRFEGRELWGESAEPGEVLFLDLWESYLELE